ncbi:hypothetical protein I4F81_006846 [Pyropia yezoensis]|uniref:Uncharacterized protein n=1 Tax=Pyropia yezoensis TaxID=2788 RepID=A0ACC3C3C3_PYRYE|nr:hypothetical protein I4F81_006846 [Neopyropia yezoensis]
MVNPQPSYGAASGSDGGEAGPGVAGPLRVGEENHAQAGEFLSDCVLGMSDGLTVPFALAAGLTSAVSSSSVIALAVTSELVAGAISMGLGGYLSGRVEADTHEAERLRESWEVQHQPKQEEDEVVEVLGRFGLNRQQCEPVLQHFREHPDQWVDFMMRFELGLGDKPDTSRPFTSALAVGGSYVVGGLVPLLPYLIIPDANTALRYSAAATLLALFVFGWVKAMLIGSPKRAKSAVETLAVGGAAAAAAYFLAKLFNVDL